MVESTVFSTGDKDKIPNFSLASADRREPRVIEDLEKSKAKHLGYRALTT